MIDKKKSMERENLWFFNWNSSEEDHRRHYIKCNMKAKFIGEAHPPKHPIFMLFVWLVILSSMKRLYCSVFTSIWKSILFAWHQELRMIQKEHRTLVDNDINPMWAWQLFFGIFFVCLALRAHLIYSLVTTAFHWHLNTNRLSSGTELFRFQIQ